MNFKRYLIEELKFTQSKNKSYLFYKRYSDFTLFFDLKNNLLSDFSIFAIKEDDSYMKREKIEQIYEVELFISKVKEYQISVNKILKEVKTQ